ncbi:transaldolase [Clostridium chauvoei]|nr:transaldolase [Clostridium chauvoei]ATD54296.1 transaldolase [Clostridium chauvoei]ATD58021.1 transaldolase [Clostridium chauvoei]CDG00903.1 Putative Transaldolase [Clostridium chauvoei JF4335]SLK13487.1 Putative Transaldolase [Clostridium chauvoei JF4335]
MVKDLKVKIFADGANLEGMLEEYKKGIVKGFTTNPSLMKAAGIKSYSEFAKLVLDNIKDMPISFEVFSDDIDEMEKEAREIASWGENIYIKIPVTNTKGEFTGKVIKNLSKDGIKVNVTAVFTVEQVKNILAVLDENTPSIISIFAGRIADTGFDPENLVKESVDFAKKNKNCEILWASCREVFNIVQADRCGCQIITVTNSNLNKLSLFGKDLKDYSLETVKGFFKDATSLGYKIL